ncbi:hypothetical protein M0R45_026847 [Rubus argutus]|uniref:Uncharacterized protein n=1 Tax=Rubus argutus TaxID=59490 RepID=A0AAW1X025_RUBAR
MNQKQKKKKPCSPIAQPTSTVVHTQRTSSVQGRATDSQAQLASLLAIKLTDAMLPSSRSIASVHRPAAMEAVNHRAAADLAVSSSHRPAIISPWAEEEIRERRDEVHGDRIERERCGKEERKTGLGQGEN